MVIDLFFVETLPGGVKTVKLSCGNVGRVRGEEILEILEDNNIVIKCANIIDFSHWNSNNIIASLKCNYSKEDYFNFLQRLDIEYNNSSREHIINGTIWLKDGTWIFREEDNGIEYWHHKKSPEIPKDLLNK